MRVGWLGTAAALALCAGIGQANAAPVLIDDFNTTQTLVANGASVSDSGGVATGADSIGGARFASIANSASSTGQSTLDINNLGNPDQTAAYSNDSNAESVLHLKWDGSTSAAVVATGLGGIDLTDLGTDDRITILAKSDLGGTAGATGTITVYTTAGDFSTATFGLPGLGTAAPFSSIDLLFGGFTAGGGTGADFANVGAIVLDLSGPQSLDAVIDFIGTAPPPQVPEPMTLSLLGLGILGLGVSRRKRGNAR